MTELALYRTNNLTKLTDRSGITRINLGMTERALDRTNNTKKDRPFRNNKNKLRNDRTGSG